MSRIPLRVPALVSVRWLVDKLNSQCPNVRVLDSSWHMPFSKRNARQEFYRNHIPRAQFFDLDDCCDKTSEYEHMLPSAEEFASYVGKLGINNTTHVVVYDNNETFGLFSSQRTWWMFRAFGHSLVSVLDGGFPKWNSMDCDTTDEVEKLQPQVFKARFNPKMVWTFEQMEKNLDTKEYQMLDARPSGRFEGTAMEPRPGVKSGHIPGGINVPFPRMIDPALKQMKTPEEIQQVFEEAGVDLDKPIVASCGSGVTACMLVLGAFLCNKQNIVVYDGSWTEWYFRAKHEHKVNMNM